MLIGPWLCLLVGRGLARVSRTVPGLIAARRIAADPWATFRAISGVVVAAMVVAYLGSTAGQLETRTEASGGVRLRPGVVEVNTGGASADRVAPLLSEQTVPPDSSLPGIIERLYIPTDGTLAAENRIRTQVANLVPNALVHSNRDLRDRNEFFPTDVARLASIGCLFMLLVGALALAAGMIAGLLERRRPFALLRASGVRIGELRRVVFLETAATMVFTSALGLGMGLVLSYISMRRDGGDWKWPELTVFAYVGSGILAALLFSAIALPLLGTTTRHESVRYE